MCGIVSGVGDAQGRPGHVLRYHSKPNFFLKGTVTMFQYIKEKHSEKLAGLVVTAVQLGKGNRKLTPGFAATKVIQNALAATLQARYDWDWLSFACLYTVINSLGGGIEGVDRIDDPNYIFNGLLEGSLFGILDQFMQNENYIRYVNGKLASGELVLAKQNEDTGSIRRRQRRRRRKVRSNL